jgi:O-antigen/teichoic acid export membrane protein
VTGIVLSAVTGVVISYIAHPYRPRLCLSQRRELIGFSKWLLINNLVSFSYLRSASFVIAKQLGAAPLGVFEISNEIARIPTTELIAPINRVIFSGYAAVAGEMAALRAAFLKAIGLIAMLAVPAGAGLAAVAEALVSVVLGPKWSEAGPLIRVLAIYGTVSALSSNTYYVHVACGDVRPFTGLMAFSSAAVIALLLFMMPRSGMEGAALAFAIVAIAMVPAYYFAVSKKLGLSVADVARVFWRPVVAATVMWVVVSRLERRLVTGLSFEDLPILAGLVAFGTVVYCSVVFGLWALAGKPDGAEQYVLESFRQVVRWLRQRVPTRL